WRSRKRQLEDGDPLPCVAAATDGDNLAGPSEIDGLDHDVNSENACRERQLEVLLEHREEPRALLRLAESIHRRPRDEFVELGPAPAAASGSCPLLALGSRHRNWEVSQLAPARSNMLHTLALDRCEGG